MSKIICDLCGTSYADTLEQCPICGTAKAEAVLSPAPEAGTDSYEYVRGGRFSKANVNRGEQPAKAERSRRESRSTGSSSNIGLIIVVAILLLAIVFICAYVAIRLIDITGSKEPNSSTGPQSSSTSQLIACTGISLPQQELEFTAVNMTILLQPVLQPADTTDVVTFASSDENVVIVDADGLVTPIFDGQATITVTCGQFQAQCSVVCSMGVLPPQPTETTPPTEPIDPTIVLTLNRIDLTLDGYGDTWDLTTDSPDRYNDYKTYEGPSDPSQITWTSDDETIATVENGKVTAVGNGKTTIYAEYGEQKVACVVRCKNVEQPVESDYRLSHTDVTMYIGEQFTIGLLYDSGAKVTGLTFVAEDPSICSVDEKGRVKALAAGNTYVTVEYEGITYQCLVRVYEKKAD